MKGRIKDRREGRETGEKGRGGRKEGCGEGGKERGEKGGLREGIEEEIWTLLDVQSQSSSCEPEPNTGKSLIMGVNMIKIYYI